MGPVPYLEILWAGSVKKVTLYIYHHGPYGIEYFPSLCFPCPACFQSTSNVIGLFIDVLDFMYPSFQNPQFLTQIYLFSDMDFSSKEGRVGDAGVSKVKLGLFFVVVNLWSLFVSNISLLCVLMSERYKLTSISSFLVSNCWLFVFNCPWNVCSSCSWQQHKEQRRFFWQPLLLIKFGRTICDWKFK